MHYACLSSLLVSEGGKVLTEEAEPFLAPNLLSIDFRFLNFMLEAPILDPQSKVKC